MINPAITKKLKESTSEGSADETGYKSSERAALENQLLQIESVANAIEQQEETTESDTVSE